MSTEVDMWIYWKQGIYELQCSKNEYPKSFCVLSDISGEISFARSPWNRQLNETIHEIPHVKRAIQVVIAAFDIYFDRAKDCSTVIMWEKSK